MHRCFSKALATVTAAAITLLPAGPAFAGDGTTTPIKHVVVIFQENVSFDHYFGTYPQAKPNSNGSLFFVARKMTRRASITSRVPGSSRTISMP